MLHYDIPGEGSHYDEVQVERFSDILDCQKGFYESWINLP